MMKKTLFTILILIFATMIFPQETESELPPPQPVPTTPASGVGLRISGFGIPNSVMDMIFYEHPKISGTSYCFEFRTFGPDGPASVFSGVFALEYSKMAGDGPYRLMKGDTLVNMAGEVSQISASATVIMSVFPNFPVSPYIGAGIGIGRVAIWYEKVLTDELGTEIKDSDHISSIFPFGHIPIGIAINVMNRGEIRVETGFKNGFYFGGGIVYYFQ